MLRKTGLLGFLSGVLLPFFKCKESFEYVGVVVKIHTGFLPSIPLQFQPIDRRMKPETNPPKNIIPHIPVSVNE